MRFVKLADIGDFLIIDSSFSEESIINFITENEIENLSINEFDGYTSKNLSRYTSLPSVKRVELIQNKIDLSNLSGLEKLTYLYLNNKIEKKFDFSVLKKIKYLNIEWNSKIVNIEQLENIEELTLRKFNGDINQLSNLRLLRKLSFIQGNVNDLTFVSSLKKIQYLSLSYLKNIVTISPLRPTKIFELEIDHCKNIKYESDLGCLKSLKKLIISNSAQIPNLNFIQHLDGLNYFSFVGTTVADGDIIPAKDIDYVSFDNKRGYNCKNVDGKVIQKK